MKKDVKIKITNEDGSVKQNSIHQVFLNYSQMTHDPEIQQLVDEAVKKFKDSGEVADEIVVTETYFYG